MQLLLISDANVLIDLEEGGLTVELFRLPYVLTVPDILFIDELELHHGHLLELGLQLRELTSDSMTYAQQLVRRYGGPSANDCLALALARQEACPLVTGDKRLRKAADQEQVEKRGTIWLLEQMLDHRLITVQQAEAARDLMRQAGSRLPWDKLDQLIERFNP
ncbi:PIN domain-containing protein [Halovibrio sp. HP20-50]|uniref:PIN domain-containing protein n=1 Tax=Halovibrio sp. HP20-59 TaxID=3080275 RepID=UPI00294B97EC|nr:PIN domain-containing protein [Halovibrio sp. HP20-59]MEA2119748.1 PIN domain-containing protein [Halovibrio sp. HP20-59]